VSFAALVFLYLAISCKAFQNSFSSEMLVFLPLMRIERLMTAVFIANFRSDPFVASVGLLPNGGVKRLALRQKKYTKRMAA
jgi:hypothetical protein